MTVLLAVYGFMKEDDKVLWLRRGKTGYMDGCLCPPAGHVKPMESIRAAMAREIDEEVGVQPIGMTLIHTLHRMGPDKEYLDFFFEIPAWVGIPKNKEPEKHSELIWAPAEAASTDLMSYIRTALERTAAGISFSELFSR
jgi:8-oxo-dGTP pyrophosphatase MutT (NUDIX family)